MIRNRIILIVLAGSTCAILDAPSNLIIGFGVYFAVSIAIAIAYHFHRKPSNFRRFIGLLTDFSAIAYGFQVGGESGEAFYPLMLWVILGNGFRFGVPWIFLASAMAAIAFGWTVYTVDFWRDNPSLSTGLLVGLVVIPAYCSTLITKLSQARDEAEEASKSKSLFLASVSHELRTPLNAIIGYGTHLLDMKLPEKQHHMIATSVTAGRHLLHLIDQLLNFAQSDSIDELPEPKSFSLVDILSEVRDIMQLAADDKNLKIVLQAEPGSDRILSGQYDYIRNILINLTSNAVKFTASGSITLRCGICSEEGNRQLWLSVTDTGPGIPEEAQQKIFDVFQQADDTVASKYGGTGLGLAICQKLAVQMDGHIALESKPGAGSKFTLFVPAEFVELSGQSSDLDSVKILSLSRDPQAPEICDTDNQAVLIDHFQCDRSTDILAILEQHRTACYDIALLDEAIANDHDDRSPLWTAFRDAGLPPVLFADNNAKKLNDLQLRAAFATILPAGSDFGAIRSAVRIGCSLNNAEPHYQSHADSPHLPVDVSPVRVLIADDNRTNQMVLETILGNAGHEVTVVVDGEKALEALETRSFDIVFLDVNMPVMGGVECCKLWRQIEGPRKHTPIVGLTADSTEETEIKCLDAGMDLRITKPVEASKLTEVIASLVINTGGTAGDQASGDPLGIIRNLDGQKHQPDPPAIDPEQLDYLLSIGDEAFVQSIIDAYLEDTNEILESFRKSVEDGSVDDFRFHSHAFKSGAANVGATPLVMLCSKLESIGEQDFADQRFAYLAQIEKLVAEIRMCLDNASTSNQKELLDGQNSADLADRHTARNER